MNLEFFLGTLWGIFVSSIVMATSPWWLQFIRPLMDWLTERRRGRGVS